MINNGPIIREIQSEMILALDAMPEQLEDLIKNDHQNDVYPEPYNQARGIFFASVDVASA